jgi:hypothetical protein
MTPALSGWRRWLVPLQRAFAIVALLFLAGAAYAHRELFAEVIAKADAGWLGAGLLAWAAVHLLSALAAWWVVGGLGQPLTYADLLAIHLRWLPARYLPGGIWHTVSRGVQLNARGMVRNELAALFLFENAAPLAVGLVLGGAFALAAGEERFPAEALVATGVLLAVVLPWLQRRLFPTSTRLPPLRYAGLLVTMALFWLLAGASFVFYLGAFPETAVVGHVLHALSAYLLSWSAGFVAVFAPQGLGVFEAVASLLLESTIPFGSMAVLIAGFRAVMLSGDLLAFVAGSAWRALGRTL